MRWHWYDILQVLGSIAGITGVSLLGHVSERTRGIALILIIIGVFAAVIASVIARVQPMTKVGRDAMVDTGRSVIRSAKAQVIMFGGDMSWAADYQEAIRYAAERGKSVVVIFPRQPRSSRTLGS